jgi:2-hydroxychromene-2-carboxylate isomerase
MGFDQYHEPANELPPETRTFARMIASLTEEAEAIGWYEQRLAVEPDAQARAIMANAQGEEFKHFGMDLEFLLRQKPKWHVALQDLLFKEGDIVEHGEEAEEAEQKLHDAEPLYPKAIEMPHLTVPVSERDHRQGSVTAAVTLVEYGDYESHYCALAYPVVKEIQRQLGPNLCFVFRHFPVAQFHPHARHAAEAAEAASAKGKFWQMHEMLFEHQDALGNEHLLHHAAALGLDTEGFKWELQNHVFAHRVSEDAESGRHSRVSGTPTFFINGIRHDDTYTLDVLLSAVRSALTLD